MKTMFILGKNQKHKIIKETQCCQSENLTKMWENLTDYLTIFDQKSDQNLTKSEQKSDLTRNFPKQTSTNIYVNHHISTYENMPEMNHHSC